MRYSKEEKLSLVNFYYNGKSVTEICMEHQIPRSKHLLHLDSGLSTCRIQEQFPYRYPERL